MFDMFRKSIICIVLFLVGFGVSNAQSDGKQDALDKSQWESLSKELEYPREQMPVKEVAIPNTTPNVSFSWLKYLLFGVIVAALVFVIYLIAKNIEPSNKSLSRDSLYNFDGLEEDIHETDLESILRQAIEKGLYNLAIRVQFLIIIKTLSESGEILWKADKTNRAYLIEMKAHKEYRSFYQLTRLYEKIWFGNEALSEPLYEKVSPVYKQFNQTLSKNEK